MWFGLDFKMRPEFFLPVIAGVCTLLFVSVRRFGGIYFRQAERCLQIT
jgi:hypothetical protein